MNLRAARNNAQHAPRYRPHKGPRKPRAPLGPLVECAGCGARKRKPLEARLAGTVWPLGKEPKRIERGSPVCVWCYVQIESFGRTRLDVEDGTPKEPATTEITSLR